MNVNHELKFSLKNHTCAKSVRCESVVLPHFHTSPEFIYVINGSITATVDDITDMLYPGDFCLVLPNQVHAYYPAPDTQWYGVVFSIDYVSQFDLETQGKVANKFKFKCSDVVTDFFKKTLMPDGSRDYYQYCSVLNAICGEFMRSVTLSDAEHSVVENRIKIIEFMRENYVNNISFKDIAELLGYEYHYASRYFNNIFSTSFKDLLNLYRLNHAKNLVTHTQKSFTDIAYESGFQSLKHFNDLFKKEYQSTPQECREEHLKKFFHCIK